MAAITVLLPVYRGANTLSEALDSVLQQTFRDFELLVIDDGSPDKSWDIIQRYAARDNRVRPIQNASNIGLAASLNKGLAFASAPLVARLDHDDLALPQRLERQASFMNANPSVAMAGSFVYHMGRVPSRDHLVTLPVDHATIAKALPSYNCFYHPSVIMRRDVVLAEGGYIPDFKNAEDYELWLRLSRRHELANIPEPLVRYRFSLDGMSLSRRWEQLYYVFLAQASHQNPNVPIAELAETAQKNLDAINRRHFMAQIAGGTIHELLRLGLWEDAIRLFMRYRKEASPRRIYRVWASLRRAG